MLWYSKSCDCNQDECNWQYAVWLPNPTNHCGMQTAPCLLQRWVEVPTPFQVAQRPALRSHLLKNRPTYKRHLVASWAHLHNRQCSQEPLRLLLRSMRILCLSQGIPGSTWTEVGAQVMSTGVFGLFRCRFWPTRHFPHEEDSVAPSVSNSSWPSLRVHFRVQTETLPNWRSRLSNNHEPSTLVWFNGKLPTRLNWAGCQWVTQQVHP